MKQILFVDDDADVREVVKLIFESSGYKVNECERGDCILKIERDFPDLIILDKQLPDMDGLEVCRKLKQSKRTKDIPIIMLSASPNIKILGANAGAEESLEKPFDVQHLKDVVAKYIH